MIVLSFSNFKCYTIIYFKNVHYQNLDFKFNTIRILIT